MNAKNYKNDYSSFDRPEIIDCVFHPRGDYLGPASTETSKQLDFEVEDGITIGATLHHSNKSNPVIIFFHGNGEIVSDYDDLGPLFLKIGINFFPFDYRGYGRSNGSPSLTNMMNDCHLLFKQAKGWLSQNGFTGPLIVMGRSLGSAPALELASAYEDEIDALIIESGFAYMMPLIRLLGISKDYPGINEENGPKNYEKIQNFKKATLIIHAEEDHIIPFSDGETLYKNSKAVSKKLLEIKGADHNSIFSIGFKNYMQSIEELMKKV